jgi:hypothetical protein
MVAHLPNIRRVYSRPWRDGGLANPGKVVGVRPDTTQRYKGCVSALSSHQRPARALRSGCRWILSNDNLLWLSLAVCIPVCKMQFLP